MKKVVSYRFYAVQDVGVKDSNEMVTFSYLTYLYLRNQQRRQFWVHPINSERQSHGHYFQLYKQLRKDNVKFFNYFRMSISSFDELLSYIENDIKRQDTNMRIAIQPEEKLVITLRYVHIFKNQVIMKYIKLNNKKININLNIIIFIK